MSSLLPLRTYNLSLVPYNPAPAIEDEFPVTVRLTIAALDPESLDDKAEPLTLRMLTRLKLLDELEAEEGSDSEEDEDEEEDELDDEVAVKQEEEDDDLEEGSEDSGEESDDDDVQEFVLCTLGPNVAYQQTLDLTISPDEEVYFVVTGSYPIHLSGNYVEHPNDELSDSDDYDSEEDISEGEEDISEVEEESDVESKIEALVGKRSAEEEERPSKKAKKEKKAVEFSKPLEQGPTPSKKTPEAKKTPEGKKTPESTPSKEAKATPSKEAKTTPSKEAKSPKVLVKTLAGGVVIEDRTVGTGPGVKKGARVSMRYIGKLKNGKVFDKNTSGKPFVFGLGKGEVIKGWDVGVAGMAVGGERRIVVPAPMAYGKQALPGIPANLELTFDVKLVGFK